MKFFLILLGYLFLITKPLLANKGFVIKNKYPNNIKKNFISLRVYLNLILKQYLNTL